MGKSDFKREQKEEGNNREERTIGQMGRGRENEKGYHFSCLLLRGKRFYVFRLHIKG